MISIQNFINNLIKNQISLATGVPDSLLSSFSAYLQDNSKLMKHIIAANEGNAIGIACGHYLATSKPSLVYMQNSGLGNAINPLTSLADAKVYSIPMLLMIGYRGEPNHKDEPQHVKQGEITLSQLDLLGIDYWLIDQDSDIESILYQAFDVMNKKSRPVAIVVKKDSFQDYKSKLNKKPMSALKREQVLDYLLRELTNTETLFVATTGKTSREVFEIRKKHNQPNTDFLTVGGMGHTSAIALGVALSKPNKRVICLDGDGSVLMHMGNLPIIGSESPENLIHILLNNAAHESVGGQPTVADKVDFKSIAIACGYKSFNKIENQTDLEQIKTIISAIKMPALIEIKIDIGSRPDLGRPSASPIENKLAFMEACRD
jgi:phosphonopyruvate decarboxylase